MGKLHKIRQAYSKLPLAEKRRIQHQRTGVLFIDSHVVFPSHFVKSYRSFLIALSNKEFRNKGGIGVWIE